KFIMVNKALCNFLGYSEEELKLKSLSEVTHPDDIETSRLEGEKLYTKQKIQIEIEKRYIHSDGSIKWGKLHAKLIFNSEGKPIYFIPIIQDITKRKESELKEKDSKEMLESIIDNIPEIIFLKDSKDLSFKLFNKAGESFLKKKRDELIGKTDYDLFEKQIAEKLTSKDRVVLEKKGEIDTHEEVVSTPFGNRIMRTKKLALLDENKKPKYLLGIAKDITEEKLINTEIKILKEVADLAGKAKSEFLTNISHELRTPLNGIIGLAETLSSANLPDELSNHAKTIFQSANSLLEMYNNILNYTSQEEKNAVLNFEKIQIIDIFSKAKANIQFLANKKRIKVKTIINPQDLSFFFSDKVRLNQIFLNLLNNAIHYTQKGEIEIKAEVLEKSFQDGNYKIRFSVKDTGTGISKEELKSIQEDIDGNSAKEKFNGSEGLGLVVTNRILSNLNSKLEIESEEGKGSLFYFDLIVNSENKVKSFVKPIVKIDEKIKERNKENFKWKILLVDDDDINLYVIMELLKLILSNVEFLIAKNGKSAIEQFQQNSPDIIFMDVQMPIKNGYEATEEIRKIEKEPKVPIIAITAGTISGDREKCLSSGMNDYAGKPIRKEILNEILDKWLLKEPI
ncbi:MAG: PAS domain S-box protein, partial [Leptospiraceae bacterium]|nr:PAS domain S-box protein [Leptospiraceae bacterium]